MTRPLYNYDEFVDLFMKSQDYSDVYQVVEVLLWEEAKFNAEEFKRLFWVATLTIKALQLD